MQHNVTSSNLSQCDLFVCLVAFNTTSISVSFCQQKQHISLADQRSDSKAVVDLVTRAGQKVLPVVAYSMPLHQ
jgi:hypothetical protein